jgi:hypothetical protein
MRWLPLVVLAIVTAAPAATGARPRVAPAGTLAVARAAHTATLLRSGRVLVAGGCTVDGCELDSRSATTELYDPSRRRFTPGPRLLRPRVGHAAVRLADGSVLVIGGWTGRRPTASVERWDGRRGRFAAAAPLRTPRGGFSLTVLPGGRVLVIGGMDGERTLRSAELYDSVTRRWTGAGETATPRSAHAAALLPGGRVLVTGGSDDDNRVTATAEIWDPATRSFSAAPAMHVRRHKQAAVSLADGRVLVIGGSDERDFQGRYASAEVFDPRTREWSRTGPLGARRFKLPDAVVRLRSGEVVVAGGAPSVEVWSPRTGRFRAVGRTASARAFATATRLAGGDVLVVGGYDDRIAVGRGAWRVRSR